MSGLTGTLMAGAPHIADVLHHLAELRSGQSIFVDGPIFASHDHTVCLPHAHCCILFCRIPVRVMDVSGLILSTVILNLCH